jgi:hypothetical protein
VPPGIEPSNPGKRHEQLLADLQELIAEAQTLQRELSTVAGSTMSVQCFQCTQTIGRPSSRIRNTLKHQG